MSVQGYFSRAIEKGAAAEKNEEISKEDLEIIENLDFLEDLELFKEDLELLKEYDDVDQQELTGENDE